MYAQVNALLNDIFLRRENEGKPVYLVLSKDQRRKLANALRCSEDRAEAHACGIVGSSLLQVGNPYAAHNEQLQAWNNKARVDFPPFTALLYTLAHAAELMVSSEEFSANNYYERLASLTRVPAHNLSHNGRETKKFWIALSRWLAAKNFAYGVPTAAELGSFPYVGLALSQAVMREVDRQSLHTLFEKYGFSGSDALSIEEMEQYIAAWITGSQASSGLKKMWGRAGYRQRICEIALSELEEWNGSDRAKQSGGQAVATRLKLVLSIINRLTGRIASISLGREESIGKSLKLTIAPPGAGDLVLSNSIYGNFATLSGARARDVEQLLLRGLSCLRSDGGGKFEWQPQFAIPFRRSEKGPFWIEVPHVTVGVEHFILLRDDSKKVDEVERYLSLAAEPGFLVSNAKQVPEGWILYERVKIVRTLADNQVEQSRDLAALWPLTEVGSIQLDGGLKLGRNVWHKSVPLRASIAGIENGAIEVVGDNEAAHGQAPVITSSAVAAGEAALVLAPGDWPIGGHVTFRVRPSTMLIRTVEVLGRTGDTPLPFARGDKGLLAYRTVSTAADHPGESDGQVMGLAARSDFSRQASLSILDRFEDMSGEGGDEDLAPVVAARTNNSRPVKVKSHQTIEEIAESLRGKSCVERGCHRWILPQLHSGPSVQSLVEAHCGDCHLNIVMRRRIGRRGDVHDDNRLVSTSRVPSRRKPADVPPEPPREISFDIVLDALCYQGCGSWSSFETLVSSQVDEPWQLHGLARDLGMLGHVDLALDKGSGRLKNWSVPQATLCFVADRRAVLAGFRSARLLDEIQDAAEAAGATLLRREAPRQPSIYELCGLDALGARLAFSNIKDPHGRPITIASEGANGLARAALSLGGLFGLMSKLIVGKRRDLAAYEVRTGKWRPVERFASEGAYRYMGSGVTYVYRDAEGSTYRGPHELVKLLHARSSHVNLHFYEVESRTFVSRLGCEPIGLAGRALTACGGKLPSTVGGQSRFDDVPPNVAAAVLECLYREDMPK